VTRSRRQRGTRRLWWVLAGIGASLLAYSVYVLAGLPPRAEIRTLRRTNPRETSVMRQRAAEARRAGRRPHRVQQWVSLRHVSRSLIYAVVAAEDAKFFGHEGFDWEAMRESVERNVKRHRFARGGSTITQQLAKNLYFSTHKSITRKLREVIVTSWIEDEISKPRILELYLNLIEWGDGIYGCEAAARFYYGKPAAALDDVEAAGLAAMIPNPHKINPRVSPQRHARAQRRVLRLMKLQGYLRWDVAGLGQAPPAPTPSSTGEAEVEED
jgi:monofunctional biosynthetic peptidoglycan transglycosylase